MSETETAATPRDEVYSRRIGIIWVLMAVLGGFGLFYIRSRVIVPDDAAQTVANLQSSEFLYRLAILSTLAGQIALVYLAVELYRLFSGVSRQLSLVLLISFLIAAVLTVANTMNHFAALLVLNQAPFLNGFSKDAITSVAYAFARAANGPGQGLIELFWPSAYSAFGLLILRSRVVPRPLGYLLLLMAAGFAINLLDKFIFPHFYPVQFTQLAMLTAGIGGVPNMLWFLIRGVKTLDSEQ